ncbi:hypothetical protein SK128_000420 [Halocaridina rubra]|uniref:Uncharacterized protein n=1 Tax=Halocaridina rubra TaxID=373956 RepID=A0AAN8XL25_HALRR
MSKCEVNPEGDIVTWSRSWILYEVQEEQAALEDLCRSVNYGEVAVSLPLLWFPHAVDVCKGLRGFIRVPRNSEEIRKEMAYLSDKGVCERQWAGITDETQEGIFKDVFLDASYNINKRAFKNRQHISHPSSFE